MTHQTMPTSSSSASRASSSSQAIVGVGDRGGRVRRRVGAFGAAVILGSGVGCSVSPPAPPQAPLTVRAAPPLPAVPQPVRSRWIAVDWAQLPGWHDDRTADAWAALLRGCDRADATWRTLCAEARLTEPPDDRAAREWLMQRLQPYRIEAPDGGATGLITGYYEPLVDASRTKRGAYQTALHAPPADLGQRKPYWTRQQLDTVPAAMAALRGRELAYVADPLDALVLQIQGSGRLKITEPDGRVRTVRLAYAGTNDQPYASVGRWLIDQGQLKPDGANWPAIKDWARRYPQRVNELLWSNPRVVFFREEPLPDPGVGPRGAMGVALTPGRSVAVDPLSVPYGTLLWIDATEPFSSRPLQRLVAAQDTGSAITGAVRADYFWGWGAEAEAQAGRMKQPLRWWALWPKGR
ncbi:MAG: MltA domain-containing protein [Burkholderiales bacterium]|nr:MltA domain-containing protein [Burkholderiales bacterium]